MSEELKENTVSETLKVVMTKNDFLKKMGFGDRKGKVESVYARSNSYDDEVEVTIDIKTEDKLHQIDFTKTVKKDN